MRRSQWAALVLSDAGLPQTQHNIRDMERWMEGENPATDWFNRNNPLNASLDTGTVNGTGSYPSLQVGAQETADMIRQSNMIGIYDALEHNAPTSTFSRAVVESPWASSHYGGNPNYFDNINPGAGYPGHVGVGGTGPAPNHYSHPNAGNNGFVNWLTSIPGDVGTGVVDAVTWPLTAGEEAVGFGVGLVWPLILRVILTLTFLVIAFILIWHEVSKGGGIPGPGKAAKELGKAVAVAAVA